MERDPKTLLFEIAESCRMILAFTAGLDLAAYSAGALFKSAAERQFIVIGEALNRLKQADATIFNALTDASQIVGFRNILVHGYDVVSDELVWEIISEHVPVLLVQCEEHLK